MNRLAFVSDIHANLQAFDAVLEAIDGLACDGVICLGDLVGYGARPVECIERIRALGAQCVLGNHDALVAGIEAGESYNENSRIAARVHRKMLSEDDLAFLSGLPMKIPFGSDTMFCHGTPESYNQYTYFPVDFEGLTVAMVGQGMRKAFLGHTHVPVFFDGERLSYRTDQEFRFEPDRGYVINPGSVGQPRDADPRASFAVWDRGADTLTFHRVEYDVAGAQADILAAGLPAHLADRLLRGK